MKVNSEKENINLDQNSKLNLSLNQGWLMKYKDIELANINVPCSLYSVLLERNLISDPFYRDNEYAIRDMSREDCEFYKEFFVTEDVLLKDDILLRLNGVDTIAYVYLNGVFIGETDNMYRIWDFDVKKNLQNGKNNLSVKIKSPLLYCEKKDEEYPLWGLPMVCTGYQHIRKAHSMFGWDWGPQLPDMGIWRNVELIASDICKINDVLITQKHHDKKVELQIKSSLTIGKEEKSDLELRIEIKSPTGEILSLSQNIINGINYSKILIDNPMLWWPNGYGKQNLYKTIVTLYKGGIEIDYKESRIGLRKLTVSTKKDEWGREFCFVINGEKIFSMGADYIPEDSIIPRMSREKTKQLIEDCVAANFNSIRVWGGGFYPEDYFYDLCDENGLIVWQDFMFACATYIMTPKFEKNLKNEFKDVLIRIRNHASLGLLCGNNEMEIAWLEWKLPNDERVKQDYIYLYERLLPQICSELAPNTFYWPASPSSGGGFNDPNSYNAGDVHYWQVWHGNKPFEEYRKYFFRYCSEFGFEAFPNIKTIKTFANNDDLNPFSLVMESHQKCDSGNSKILTYLSENYLYPMSFEKLVYTSQLLQADAIRYGVEHFRRFRGRCMGAIYWQLNDCWPGPSWSSRDYYGRWKALHYSAKRFFAPILLSAHNNGYEVTLNVSNETMEAFSGNVRYSVNDNVLNEIEEGSFDISSSKLNSVDIISINIEKSIKGFERERYLVFTLEDGQGSIISKETLMFCKPKHYKFNKPDIKIEVRNIKIEEANIKDEVKKINEKIEIVLTADQFAKGVFVDFEGIDCTLSDNFFDIHDKTSKIVRVEKCSNPNVTVEEIINNIKVLSVYDINKD